jgi:hypothetical protein
MEIKMTWAKKAGVFFVSSAMAGVPLASSVAQPRWETPWMSGYVPAHAAGNRHCPGLAWHISPVEQANQTYDLSGPIWYDDGSGMSFAKGTRQANGAFSLKVKRESGDGPTGMITGQRMPDGSADVTTTGSPCFAGTYHLAPGQTSSK